MPRKVPVASKESEASSFPLPPDPSSQNRRRDEAIAEDPKGPSTPAGFLPPAPTDDRHLDAKAALDPSGNVNHSWSANDENRHHNATAQHHYANQQYEHHDNEAAWQEWHSQQQHGHNTQQHSYYYQQGHPYWHHYQQQHYYDEHNQQQSAQPNSAHQEQYQYHEFMPPLEKDGEAKQKGNQHYHYHGAPTYPPPTQRDSKRKDTRQQHPYAHPSVPPVWNNNTAYKQREQMIQQQSEVERIPVYPYSDEFKDKSFDEMINLWKEWQRNHSGVDVEQQVLQQQQGRTINDGPLDDGSLILSSWIKELRWIRRARAPSDEKSPKATRGRDKLPSFAPLPDCLELSPARIEELDASNFPWYHDRSSWQKWLDDILHYRAKTGAAYVPLKYTEYPSLGNFVNRQRTEYRKLLQGRSSSMTSSKVTDLNRVGFCWSIREGGHISWDTRLMELREYQIQNGHCNVPKLYKPNPSLGYWVNEQRFQYRRMLNNKPSYMNDSKVANLNALGFVWTLRESKKPWEDWIKELSVYKEIHGHVDVPLKYEKNTQLGAWVNNQRSEYRKLQRGEASSMTREKIKQLEEMGFRWSVRESRTPWTTRLKELKEYKAKFGDCNVPKNWEGGTLSYWVDKQRQQYKLFGVSPCHLTKERVEALNELGFDWMGSVLVEGASQVGTEEGKQVWKIENETTV